MTPPTATRAPGLDSSGPARNADTVVQALGALALAQERDYAADMIARLTENVYRAMGPAADRIGHAR